MSYLLGPKNGSIPDVSFETSEQIRVFMSDEKNFKTYKKFLHILCMKIISEHRRSAVDLTKFDADKEYKKIRKEFLGKSRLLVLTNKQVTARIDRKYKNGTKDGFRVLDNMSNEEKAEADESISFSNIVPEKNVDQVLDNLTIVVGEKGRESYYKSGVLIKEVIE